MSGKKGFISGFLMGMSNFILVFQYAINFLAGSFFTKYYGLKIDNSKYFIKIN